jgi:hypothetical protein
MRQHDGDASGKDDGKRADAQVGEVGEDTDHRQWQEQPRAAAG